VARPIMSKVHPVPASEVKVHPPGSMAPSSESPSAISDPSLFDPAKPFVFRKLFGLNNSSQADMGEYASASTPHLLQTMHSRRISSSVLDISAGIGPGHMRRKSTAGHGQLTAAASAILTTTDEHPGDAALIEDQSEGIELLLLNHVSATVTELKRFDDDAWKEFNALTSKIYSQISHQDTHEQLRAVLIEHGFTTKHGWRPHDVDVGGLLQAFSNIYIAEKAKHTPVHDAHIKIKNIQALTFCPNILFSNFPHEFKPEPCSISVQSAVLLADISGFSKFAGEMCLRGAKGLDVLHKVTSDFLGHFVHTVYDFDGDGTLHILRRSFGKIAHVNVFSDRVRWRCIGMHIPCHDGRQRGKVQESL
jgi:hypothetical protein